MSNKNGAAAVNNPFAALKHKNFRYYWIGMAISTTGSWMQNAAQPWLAYKLTDSAFLLSLVSALQFTPVLLFSLFAGVLIDRFKKKNIVIVTQIASFFITLAIAVLVATGRIEYWHLIISSALLGFVNTFDAPARQSFVIELVGKDDLAGGIALNSAQFNLARILGPALAGIIMAGWNISACFFINAVSFGAVLISLFFIKPMTVTKQAAKIENIFKDIGAGLKFIFGKPILYMPLLFLAIGAIFAMNLNCLIPVFSKEVLLQEETGYGFLMSMGGVGALTGALTMASLSKGGVKNAFVFVFSAYSRRFGCGHRFYKGLCAYGNCRCVDELCLYDLFGKRQHNDPAKLDQRIQRTRDERLFDRHVRINAARQSVFRSHSRGIRCRCILCCLRCDHYCRAAAAVFCSKEKTAERPAAGKRHFIKCLE